MNICGFLPIYRTDLRERMPMKYLITHLRLALLIAFVVIPLQLVNISAAHASGSADLYITNLHISYSGQVLIFDVCTQAGSDTVSQFTLDFNVSNLDIQSSFGAGTTMSTDQGSFNASVTTWSGSLTPGDCLSVASIGNVTGPVGDEVSGTVSIASSVLEDTSTNVDPNTVDNSATFTPFTIPNPPDLALTARLLTSGTITTNTPVSYEMTINNVGVGVQPSGEYSMTLAFLIPDSATYTSVVDLDPTDPVTMHNSDCNFLGDSSNLNAATGAAHPGTIVYCNLDASQDFEAGATTHFQFNMTANSDFVSGDVKVVGVVVGQDRDSIYLQADLGNNIDIFARDSNNYVNLTYDDTELNVTVNRCPGQGATTTNGTGCFRVSFSKLIYAPSFTVDDIVLTPSGSVTSFTQLDDYTWEVHVAGITPGTTLALSLGAASVEDYSAVQNGVQVLGENTIRYETESASSSGSTSASGTLAETGKHVDITTPLLLLALGLVLVWYSSRKKNAVV